MKELVNEIDILQGFNYVTLMEENGYHKIMIRFHQNVESLENQEDKERLFNLHNVVIDGDGRVVCRGLPFFAKYDKLSRVQQADFLSDNMTMIEFIQGDRVNVSFIDNEIFISTNSSHVKENINLIYDAEKDLKKINDFVSKKYDDKFSICMKLSKDNLLYIEGIVNNSDAPEFLEEKVIDMIVMNFYKHSDFSRPMHYTTSHNESNHKPNTEWIIRNGNSFCLMLSKLKQEK